MTIRRFFEEAVRDTPEAPAQKFYARDHWVTRSYAELNERVVRAATLVARLSVRPGVENVALMLENCPEWQEIYLALAGSGVAVVPIDPKLRELEVTHILVDSEAVAVFAGTKQREMLGAIGPGLPNLRACVWVGEGSADVADIPGRAGCSYETRMAGGRLALEEGLAWFAANRPEEDTVASIIYTSGTTGRPKGAMLTHGNFTSNVAAIVKRFGFYPSDNFLNMLPLFHAFSFTANFMLPLGVKACCSFMRSMRTAADDMRELQPSVLLAVPLLAEKLYARVAERIKNNLVARGLMGIGLKAVVRKKVIESFGGKLRLLGIGGAPAPLAVLKGFLNVGVPVLEGYGLTECAPGVAYPSPDSYIPGTVGCVLSNIDFKVADTDASGAGELCVKGPSVMKGYYKNREATAAAFDADGFFRTGDLVRLDDSGNVTICGRKKALIVNREGKNIYSEEVEHVIQSSPFVKDVVVLGYRVGDECGERVGAIIVPDHEAVASAHNGELPERAQVDALMREQVFGACRERVSDYKIPRKIVVRHEPLMRTSTMKVRRILYEGTLDEREIVCVSDDGSIDE